MQQTLLALLAMMTVTMLAFNQQRAHIETRKAMINDEMEVMASGIALQAMEYIGSKAFDENLKGLGAPASDPGRLGRADNLVSLLTPVQNLPSGRRCPLSAADEGEPGYETCDDLSDFHRMQQERVPFPVGEQIVYFHVTAQVRYVDADHRPAYGSNLTKNKEVVLSVVPEMPEGPPSFPVSPIQLSRTFSIP